MVSGIALGDIKKAGKKRSINHVARAATLLSTTIPTTAIVHALLNHHHLLLPQPPNSCLSTCNADMISSLPAGAQPRCHPPFGNMDILDRLSTPMSISTSTHRQPPQPLSSVHLVYLHSVISRFISHNFVIHKRTPKCLIQTLASSILSNPNINNNLLLLTSSNNLTSFHFRSLTLTSSSPLKMNLRQSLINQRYKIISCFSFWSTWTFLLVQNHSC